MADHSDKQSWHRLHAPLHAPRARFTPATFLLYIDLPSEAFLSTGNRREYATLWHEYQHFLQCTTTTHGVSEFRDEYRITELTIECLRELLRGGYRIRVPIEAWLERGPAPKANRILRHYSRQREAIVREVMARRGLGSYDSKDDTIHIQGEALPASKRCPALRYPGRIGPQDVPVGSWAIMEGAAAAIEYHYLQFAALTSKEKLPAQLADRWRREPPEDPVYRVAFDLALEILGDKIEAFLAIADLALCPPLDFANESPSIVAAPGVRFLAACETARSLPQLRFAEFHREYRGYVDAICQKLRWRRPWEVADGALSADIDKRFLFTKGAGLCDMIGPALTLLTGLTARQRVPSLCANPVPLGLPDMEGEGSKVLFTMMVYHAHPPPFTRVSDGSVLLSHGAFEAMNGQMPITREEYETEVRDSFDKYFFLQGLAQAIWTGWNVSGNRLNCLQPHRRSEDHCQGWMTVGESGNKSECRCRRMMHEILGCDPEGMTRVDAGSAD